MLPEFGHIGPITFRTYTALLDVAILFGLALLAWQGQRREGRPVAWLDVGLATLAGGLVGARLLHAALHWGYFAERPGEVLQVWRGGLDWHGAVLGGLLALFVAARLRGVSWRPLTDALAFALPVGAALAFAGCLPSGCAAGREVASLADYPAPLVAELPDIYGLVAPRLASQLYGVALSLALLGVVWFLNRRLRRPGLSLWPVLSLLTLGLFGISFTLAAEGPAWGGLRLDQLLDLAVAALSAAMSVVAVRLPGGRGPPPASDSSAAPQGVKHAN